MSDTDTADLTRTVTVLERNTPHPAFSEPIGEGETKDDVRAHLLYLDPDVFDDMGKPETVTVTIEPGDRLNGLGVDWSVGGDLLTNTATYRSWDSCPPDLAAAVRDAVMEAGGSMCFSEEEGREIASRLVAKISTEVAELNWWRQVFRPRLFDPTCDYVPRPGDPLGGRRFRIVEMKGSDTQVPTDVLVGDPPPGPIRIDLGDSEDGLPVIRRMARVLHRHGTDITVLLRGEPIDLEVVDREAEAQFDGLDDAEWTFGRAGEDRTYSIKLGYPD